MVNQANEINRKADVVILIAHHVEIRPQEAFWETAGVLENAKHHVLSEDRTLTARKPPV